MSAAKAKRVKARKVLTSFYVQDGRIEQVWQLPADAASYEKMVEQVAHGFCKSDNLTWGELHYSAAKYYNRFSRAALAAIGIKEPRK